MRITREDRIRMERAHVRAWPPLNSVNIDGWLWRSSGGGSQRANSVSTVDFYGFDMAASIDAVQTRYRTVNSPALFQTFDETSPADLVPALRVRGYRRGSATLTLMKRGTPDARPSAVEHYHRPTDEWLQVYLSTITQDRRSANQSILAGIPEQSAFFALRRDRRIISTALCVVAFGCAVIECVATHVASRQQGAARELLAGLQSWVSRQDVDLVGLQVADDNQPAIALYQQLGFEAASTNLFWSLPAEKHQLVA